MDFSEGNALAIAERANIRRQSRRRLGNALGTTHATSHNRSLSDAQAQTNINTAYGRKAKSEVESILLANKNER
jgi:hypothetical protein